VVKPPPVARQPQHSSLLARLAHVEQSLGEVLGSKEAIFGRPGCMGAWIHDITERLERMEMLLFSCNFEQFTEIDETLRSIRKDVEPAAPTSSPGNKLRSESLSRLGSTFMDTVIEDDDEFSGIVEGADVADCFSWDSCGPGGASSWSEDLAANRWYSNLLDIDLDVNDYCDEQESCDAQQFLFVKHGTSRASSLGPLVEQLSEALASERDTTYFSEEVSIQSREHFVEDVVAKSDVEEELSFDEMIVTRMPAADLSLSSISEATGMAEESSGVEETFMHGVWL